MKNAQHYLISSMETIESRAKERDIDMERSMEATVEAFNAIYSTELTEVQGWQFMMLLKMVRARGGDYREDDYADMVSYAALAAECANETCG